MSYAYGALGDKERERAYSNRMNGIVRTILSSGDGFTQKTPRHILMFDHALDVLTVEGFSYDKSRVISRTVERVAGRIPIIAGAGSNDTAFAIEISKEAEEACADALLLVTPYYNKTSQAGLIAHYTAIANAVTLPCIIYNLSLIHI